MGVYCCGVASAAPPPPLPLTLVRTVRKERDLGLRLWKWVEEKKGLGLLFLGFVVSAEMTSMWVFEIEGNGWRR